MSEVNPMSVPDVGKTMLLEGALRGIEDGGRTLPNSTPKTLELLADQLARLR